MNFFEWASFQPRPHPSTVGELTSLRQGGPEAFREYERRFIASEPEGTHLYAWYIQPNVVVACSEPAFERVMLCVARAVSCVHAEDFFEAAQWFTRAQHHTSQWRSSIKRRVVCLQLARCAKAAQLALGATHLAAIQSVEDASTRLGLLASLFKFLAVRTTPGRTEGDAMDCIDENVIRMQKHVAREILMQAATHAIDAERDVGKGVAISQRLCDEFDDKEATQLYKRCAEVAKCLHVEEQTFSNAMLPAPIELPVFEMGLPI